MREKISTLLSVLTLLTLSLFWAPVSYAVVNTYTVTGGNPAALPTVGEASVALPTITITEDGTGDDFLNDTEQINVTLTYEGVYFDSSVNSLTVGGSCGYNATTSVLYGGVPNRTAQIFITAGGAGSCAAGQTITLNGLKVYSYYSLAAPGASSFLHADNITTSSGNTVYSSDNVNLAIAVGDLTSVNVEPAALFTATSTTATVSFTMSSIISSPNGRIQITFPSGFNVSGVNGTTASSLSGLNGTWTASVSGQVVTLTQSGGSLTTAGVKSLTLSNVVTPSAAGSTGTYTVSTLSSAIVETPGVAETGTASADVLMSLSGSGGDISALSGIEVSQTADGILISWDVPSDDTSSVQIMKGVDPGPIDGTPFATVSANLGSFADTDVEIGQTVTYVLRGASNSNTGPNSGEYSITLTESSAGEDETGSSANQTESENNGAESESVTDVEEDAVSQDAEMNDESLSVSFSDLSGHWAENMVYVLTEAGIVSGYEDGMFRPDNSLNRAEAAVLVWRVLGMENPEVTADPFPDVASSEWYASPISGLKTLGVLRGNTDGTYEPDEYINRAEFLHLALSFYYSQNPDVSSNNNGLPFYIDLDLDAWYADDVIRASELDFLEGNACGVYRCFYASNAVTRAEAAAILYRMFADIL